VSFQPALPLGGYAGWRFLARTAERQSALAAEAPVSRRETAAFRDRIAAVTSAEALIADRTLLKVALGAFGLDADLPNRAFLRRVLESAPGDPAALANRLADKRYLEFARAFGFAEPGGPNTRRQGFADRIIAAYQTRQFEVAVGARDGSLRLALTAVRELEGLAQRRGTPDALWFSVMGNPPLRQVFETALALPRGFGTLDIDRQLAVFREKTARAVGGGEISQFADPARREDLVRLFLLRSEARQSPAGQSGSAALALLQATPRPGLRAPPG
jgi:hypothetical protein